MGQYLLVSKYRTMHILQTVKKRITENLSVYTRARATTHAHTYKYSRLLLVWIGISVLTRMKTLNDGGGVNKVAAA